MLAEAEKRNEQRFQAQEAATIYARQVTNEFRGTLSDQATHFMPRAESEQRADTNAKSIAALENWRSKATGAAVVLSLFAGAFGAAIVRVFA